MKKVCKHKLLDTCPQIRDQPYGSCSGSYYSVDGSWLVRKCNVYFCIYYEKEIEVEEM